MAAFFLVVSIYQALYTRIGEGNGTPLQYCCLEKPMDGGAWWAAVHGVATSWTRLCDFTFTFHFHALEKEMATHCSVLAWRIPGTAEPGGLPSLGSHRVGHDWSDLAAAAYTRITYFKLTKPLSLVLLPFYQCQNRGLLRNYTQHFAITCKEKNMGEKGYLWMYNWITLVYAWN